MPSTRTAAGQSAKQSKAKPPAPRSVALIDWLLEGDPAIRWQTLRDLQRRPARVWQHERGQTLSEGWGAALLAVQDQDGRWADGVYSPKWTSTTYTLLTLLHIGVPHDCVAAQRGVQQALAGLLGDQLNAPFARRLASLDGCIVGMLLATASYFRVQDARTDAVLDNLLQETMADGAWNCRKGRKPTPRHSSFHTTFNVLDGLQHYLESGARRRRDEVLHARQRAVEFMLQHQLYRSHRSGEVAHKSFTMLPFPPRWHYDVLRGLEFFARIDADWDSRLADPVALLLSKRDATGRWRLQSGYHGKVFFAMERAGQPSRWNTLRALRVLRWVKRCGATLAAD